MREKNQNNLNPKIEKIDSDYVARQGRRISLKAHKTIVANRRTLACQPIPARLEKPVLTRKSHTRAFWFALLFFLAQLFIPSFSKGNKSQRVVLNRTKGRVKRTA